MHRFRADDKETLDELESRALRSIVIQFTCSRDGVICGRDERRNAYQRDLIPLMIRDGAFLLQNDRYRILEIRVPLLLTLSEFLAENCN